MSLSVVMCLKSSETAEEHMHVRKDVKGTIYYFGVLMYMVLPKPKSDLLQHHI